MLDYAPMRLVSLSQPIIIIIECICSPILKEVIALPLSQTRHILLLGVWEFEVPDAKVLMVQLEEGVVSLRVTGREEFICLLRESQRETIVLFSVLGKNLIYR